MICATRSRSRRPRCRSSPAANTCPVHEPVEITINRFVDYYQLPGVGALTKLTDAQGALNNLAAPIQGLVNKTFSFGPEPSEESQTIINAPFFIGPVPMVLQVDAYTQYGVAGALDVKLNALSVILNQVTPSTPDNAVNNEVARLEARVVPYAASWARRLRRRRHRSRRDQGQPRD